MSSSRWPALPASTGGTFVAATNAGELKQGLTTVLDADRQPGGLFAASRGGGRQFRALLAGRAPAGRGQRRADDHRSSAAAGRSP